ncbi:triosephosphate isomerase [Candidatus Gottesmanbacteria bacterium]|nr:triosephosphate isomerase [Candidatus Gottesmanbacteria bacterium]MBI5452726.1 triosephosphate isomerase [Candidatus Gottesmanbacteria bacterium]
MGNAKKYVVGNWKSNKNSGEVEIWFKQFASLFQESKNKFNNLEIVVCPPFIYLPLAKKLLENYHLPIKIGAQDVSPFPNGAYTGAVSASQISQFAKYVIIGHSERRSNFHEDDKQLSEKVKRAKEQNLGVIFCIQDENTSAPQDVQIIAYEPVWAIGTGKTDTPENADKVAAIVKEKYPDTVLLYGGSVSSENVQSFLNTSHIDGVLPGGASLDPQKFWEIVVNASKI